MLKVAGGGGGTAGLTYKGTWDASTNSPTLTSSVGTNGDYYIVSTAGNTDLDGITDWQIGDWAIFSGTVWQKIDQSNTVTSVNGETGAVVLGVANIAGAVPNTVNVIAGTALSGGGALTGNVTINLANTAVTAGNYGNSGSVGSFTVDDQGRLTAASNVTIVATQVNLSNTSANATFATSELPLVPEGYVTVNVGGDLKKIPYYGV